MLYVVGSLVLGAVFFIGYFVGSTHGYRQAHVRIVRSQIYGSHQSHGQTKSSNLRLVDKKK
jgi:hypothetical protein